MTATTWWQDLSQRKRAGMVALAAVELVLTTTAAIDLFRRPRRLVRGPKLLWWPLLSVQPFGPIAYLTLGRRSSD